jgi:hypothetical protein
MNSAATFTADAADWLFLTPDGPIAFTWNRSKTVNIHTPSGEDVWTYMEKPRITEVLRDINDWLAERYP